MKKVNNLELSVFQCAKALVEKMTLDEKLSQLKFNSDAVERLGIPAYNWWNEGLHGVARAGTATMFPQAIGLAAMFDESLLYQIGEAISLEARAKYNVASNYGDRDIYKGLTLWSPNINIFRDPRWGRGQETYGECPYLTSVLGKAFVKGLQGEEEYLRVAACAKHYAVHSGPEELRHEFNAQVSKKDLEETYLPAFKVLVEEANVEGIMGAYNRVNGEPSCASDFLQDKLKEWHFDGYFVSDCGALEDFHSNHKVTKSAVETAAFALKNGCDCNCGEVYLLLKNAYEKGLISEEDIDKATIHLMRTRIRLGLFDQDTKLNKVSYSKVCCKEHKELTLKAAEKSVVLLENNGILPLNKEKISSIAVIGPNADSRMALEGNYCGKSDQYITILEGIRETVGEDVRIYYAEGCHLYKDKVSALACKHDRYSEAVTAARMADVVLLSVGLDASIEGEQGDNSNEFGSGDKKDLYLPESQRILIEKIISLKKPTVVTVLSGSSINIETKKADALLQCFYPGESGGRALAKILFGEISPSGKLPVTFYEKAEKLPEFIDYSMKNRTYRYAQDNILYPFGYGLTYSETAVTGLTYTDGIAEVTAINKGNYDVEEVLQLYIKINGTSFAVPNWSLCGFKRVAIKSGEKITTQISMFKNAFKVVNDQGKWVSDGKNFILYAGMGQPDKRTEELYKNKAVSVKMESF